LGTLVMARAERRALAAYGVAPVPGWLRLAAAGTLWGALSNVAVIALIAVCGGFVVEGLNVHGSAVLKETVLWLLAFLAVALAEGVTSRGYPLFTVASGLGFWPAATVLSVAFGAEHYFLKPGETWVDGTTVTLVALFLCFTIRRTGSVWWAVGWHF